MKVRDKYDVPVSPLLHLYTIAHFALSFLVAHGEKTEVPSTTSQASTAVSAADGRLGY